MLKVTHRNQTASQRRYYEAAKGKDTDIIEIHDSEGNVIDERICNISILPKEDVGNRPIDKEIDGLLNFLRTGRVPSKSYVVLMTPSERLSTLKATYGDGWKSYVSNPVVQQDDIYDPFFVPLTDKRGMDLDEDSPDKRRRPSDDDKARQAAKQAIQNDLRKLDKVACMARVKKLLTACQENGLMSDDYIRDLLSDFVMAGETERIPLTVKNAYDDVVISAALLKRDYPELFAGVRDRIYSTVVMSDIDEVIDMIGYGDFEKEDGHGIGADQHNPALSPKDDDGN